ncbi:MAG TPA: heterodisulfide reductase-related iron-sulfur binding cluster [Candidatus Methylomirabilis sp.]|nr:heterodisulfide reductase-related iron-sulfur binding cluster [Candidatus Methylomirabilis sp.]
MASQPTAQAAHKSAFDAIDPPETELYLDCIRCGFCLPACPTYRILGNELDSPRGRVYLIRSASEGRIGISDNFVKHMKLCLVCRACETACPSGVRFGDLMESARGQIERHHMYRPAQRWLRDLILRTVIDADRLTWLLRGVKFYQKSGLQALLRASGLLRLFGRLGQMEGLVPSIPDLSLRHALPEMTHAIGPARGRVGLLTGCVQSVLFPGVNLATARVLSENGYEVVAPKTQRCCGSLLVHEGERERGKALARKTIEVFERAEVDTVVVNAAGCGSAMKEYDGLLRDDPRYATRAAAFAKQVKDVSEVLAAIPLDGKLGRLPLKVTYHEPCHLVHGQRVRAAPRTVIRSIPGVQFIELKESDVCCGSAGIYNLIHPTEASEVLGRKLDRIAESGAEVVVSGNPGCLIQLDVGMKRRGMTVRVAHPVELLAWSYDAGAGEGGSKAMVRAVT